MVAGPQRDRSLRERLPGVWEIRVVVGFDAVRGRSVQRSFTVRGDAVFAEHRRRELVEDHGVTRLRIQAPQPEAAAVPPSIAIRLTAPAEWSRRLAAFCADLPPK